MMSVLSMVIKTTCIITEILSSKLKSSGSECRIGGGGGEEKSNVSY